MTSENCLITADFLVHQDRKLFYVQAEPSHGDIRASILFLHPFAEEMHRSRHMVASQARALAGAGYRVMLLDLYGCGDAGGEFTDATWDIWQQDAAYAAESLAGSGGAGRRRSRVPRGSRSRWSPCPGPDGGERHWHLESACPPCPPGAGPVSGHGDPLCGLPLPRSSRPEIPGR